MIKATYTNLKTGSVWYGSVGYVAEQRKKRQQQQEQLAVRARAALDHTAENEAFELYEQNHGTDSTTQK